MKQYNVSVLHNPCSNLKLASGVAPIEEMRGAGVNICIGTDGNGSNNNLDMFRETFAASLLQKGINKNASAFDAFAALEAATVNGGKALSTGTGILKRRAGRYNAAAPISVSDAAARSVCVRCIFGREQDA